MRLNEKNVASFAVCSSPVDKEGYLQKKGDVNRDFQRRWFVLKGNLLFYFLKKQDKEPQGLIVLEACSVQISIHGRYSFEISFDGEGTRIYILGADNNEEMECWMKAISHASYEYLKTIVDELQRRVNYYSSFSNSAAAEATAMDKATVGGGATALVPSPSFRPAHQDTAVTLQDLGNPIAPMKHHKYASTKVRVHQGILVDVNTDTAPPIPAKKKSMTISTSRSSLAASSNYTDKLLNPTHYNEEVDASLSDGPRHAKSPPKSHPALVVGKSLPHLRLSDPYSSPLVPNLPLENMDKPLSPPATLDRTPILQPYSAHGEASALSTTPNLEDALSKLSAGPDRYPNSTAGSHSTYSTISTSRGGGASGSYSSSTYLSHPQPGKKVVASPLESGGKSFMDMHNDFTKAMKTLNADRTSAHFNTPP